MTNQPHIIISKLLENTISLEGHWLFRSGLTHGYGTTTIDYKTYRVHRLAAALFLGLDYNNERQQANHKCKYKNCWNPNHLYVGSQTQNISDYYKLGGVSGHKGKLKTKCKRGHDLVEDNLIKRSNGRKECLLCANLRQRKRRSNA